MNQIVETNCRLKHGSGIFVRYALGTLWVVHWALSSAFAQDISLLEQAAIQAAATKASAWLVRIETTGGVDELDEGLVPQGPSTGVVLDSDGWVISSSLPFSAKPNGIVVTLTNGERYAGKLIAVDRLRCLALLKIDATDLKTVEPIDRPIAVGHWAIALGHTFAGTSPNISVGVVSAQKRIWGKAIQTDAKISPANYGGLLIDISGKAQGVIVPLSPNDKAAMAGVEWYDSGIGFAIPIADVRAAAERMKSGSDLLPGLAGFSFVPNSALDAKPIIDRVRRRGPAEQAGIRSGEEIVALNGNGVSRIPEYRQVAGRYYAGDSVVLRIRDSKGGERDVRLVLLPKIPVYDPPFLGAIPQRPSHNRQQLRGVVDDSPASQLGLKSGDKITEVQGEPVNSLVAAAAAISRLAPAESVKLTWERDGKVQSGETLLAKMPQTLSHSSQVVTPPEDGVGTRIANNTKRGRFRATFPGHEQDYWAYVPDSWSPDETWGLVVWIHPHQSTDEAAMYDAWRLYCEQHHCILLAPLAQQIERWQSAESEFIEHVVEQFIKDYVIDSRRVALLSKESAGRFALAVAVKQRNLFRGVALIDCSGPQQMIEMEPDSPQRFLFASQELKLSETKRNRSLKPLLDANYPVVSVTLSQKPEGELATEVQQVVSRWLDALDHF